MPKRVLVVSENDQWHKLRDLGALICGLAGRVPGVEAEESHDRQVLASSALGTYDVCVLCITMGDLTQEEQQGLAAFVSGGRTVLAVHSAAVTDEDSETYIDLLGARFVHHPPYQEFLVTIADDMHPVVRGIADFAVTDELYILDRAPGGAQVLATATWEGVVHPLVYVRSYGDGRVLYIALGHDEASFTHPAFEKLMEQALAWACGMGQ